MQRRVTIFMRLVDSDVVLNQHSRRFRSSLKRDAVGRSVAIFLSDRRVRSKLEESLHDKMLACQRRSHERRLPGSWLTLIEFVFIEITARKVSHVALPRAPMRRARARHRKHESDDAQQKRTSHPRASGHCACQVFEGRGSDRYRSWFTLLSDTCRVPATMRSDVGTDEQRALVRLQTSVVYETYFEAQ